MEVWAPSFNQYDVISYGAKGDDTTDDTVALQRAINACKPGGYVSLTPGGKFRTTAPLVIPPGVSIIGSYAPRVTYGDSSSSGSYIKPKSTFVGSACILMRDKEDAGYSSENGSTRISGVLLDGSALSGSIDGIRAVGMIRDVRLENVTIRGFPRNGITTATYTRANSRVVNPYSWFLLNVMCDSNKNIGYSFTSLTDSTFIDCHSIGNSVYGYLLGGMANTQLVGCRAEWNGSHGFYITGNSNGSIMMTSVSTDRNNNHGIFIDATGNYPIMLTGLNLRRDGRNGGAYAGIKSSGSTCPIIINNIIVSTGVDDDGLGTESPHYGLSADNTSYLSVLGGYIVSTDTAWHDGGGNTSLTKSGVYSTG